MATIHLLYHPKARCQAIRKSPYIPECSETIHTSQFSACLPCLAKKTHNKGSFTHFLLAPSASGSFLLLLLLSNYFLAASGLSCCLWAPGCAREIGLLQLCHVGSVACRLSCLLACGILVPLPRVDPSSPAFAGGILNSWATRKVFS